MFSIINKNQSTKSKKKMAKPRQLVFECKIKDLLVLQYKNEKAKALLDIYTLFRNSAVSPKDPTIVNTIAHHKEEYVRAKGDPDPKWKVEQPKYKPPSKNQRMSFRSGKWIARSGHFFRTTSLNYNKPMSEACIIYKNRILSPNDKKIEKRGDFFYPIQGYRSWHTNERDRIGWRMYFIHVESCNGKQPVSTFSYQHAGKIHTCKESEDVIRIFEITKQNPLWHRVLSDGHRWSWGFLISEKLVLQLQNEKLFT